MFGRIEVKRIDKNPESNIHQEWTFVLIEETLYLDLYRCDEVVPPKRKGRNIDFYNRLSQRDSNVHLEHVPLPEDVKEEALKLYVAKLSVKKWDRN